MTVSVVIPVLDGARYLAELLEAVSAQGADQVLVIDSGSRDGSAAIARAAGAEVLEIAPEEFGHGRTRNLGGERTSGDIICFLTQDATPAPGWLDAIRAAFADDSVGAVYGPHLPRPDTSPMIARELTDFFAQEEPGGPTFLSNVNTAYRRACWEEIRFQDVPYAEDQAFGTDLAGTAWRKVFAPGAAVLHAHDFPYWSFMRRYFDEYRALRRTVGHVEPFRLKSSLAGAVRLTAADRRWMRAQGWSGGRVALWTPRAFAHHLGCKAFSVLGSRHERLPARVQAALSLEGVEKRRRQRGGDEQHHARHQ